MIEFLTGYFVGYFIGAIVCGYAYWVDAYNKKRLRYDKRHRNRDKI